jgi:hypothetical protein
LRAFMGLEPQYLEPQYEDIKIKMMMRPLCPGREVRGRASAAQY